MDHDQDGKIYRREFFQSGIIENIEKLEEYNEDDTQFNLFNYNYFYIICCLFNDLDDDEDGYLTEEDMQKYKTHNLSSLVIKRIFQQVAYKFENKSKNNLMSYKDFIWFIISEEDKSNIQSINYWFDIIDLNGDGILSYVYKLGYMN